MSLLIDCTAAPSRSDISNPLQMSVLITRDDLGRFLQSDLHEKLTTSSSHHANLNGRAWSPDNHVRSGAR